MTPLSIYLPAPWLQSHHKSAEQTDEEEKRRGAQGGDKGLGILCGQLAKGSAIVLQTKGTVMKGSGNAEAEEKW